VGAAPYRYNNYPLTNYTHAKRVDILFTTVEPFLPYIASFFGFFLHFGAIETSGTCTYITNPEKIYFDQPGCTGIGGCSHLYVNFLFAAANSGRCRFRYAPCPAFLGPSSNAVGYTKFDCNDHPNLKRTCIQATSAPLVTC
jgi:hypothetical protein